MSFILKTLFVANLLIITYAAVITSEAGKIPGGGAFGKGSIEGEIGDTKRTLTLQGNIVPGGNSNPPSGNAKGHFSVENNGNSIGVGLSQNPHGQTISQDLSINLLETNKARADVSLSHSETSTNFGKHSENSGTLSFSDAKGNSGQVSLSNIPNYQTSLTQKVNLNVVNKPEHKVNVEAFNSNVKPQNRPIQQSVGGRVTLESKGAETFVGVEHKPQFKFTEINGGVRSPLYNFPNGALLEGNLLVTRRDGPYGASNDHKIGLLVSVPVSNSQSVNWKSSSPIIPYRGFAGIPDYAAIHNLPKYQDRKFVWVAPDDARLDNSWYFGCGPACCKGKKFNPFFCR